MTNASALEYALIGLLKQKAQSGYDLRKEFASTPMRHYSDSPGSIYPALRRLQERGWINAGSEERGRKRQVFRITPTGNEAFTTWLKTMPSYDDIVWGMEEVVLRFAFHTGNVPRSVTRRFLEKLRSELTSYTSELQQYAKQSGLAKQDSTGALAFASGIEGYLAALAWTKRALRNFTETRS